MLNVVFIKKVWKVHTQHESSVAEVEIGGTPVRRLL